ncbi:MAG: D-aminoacyl-tRNA deacylase [Methanothrix sp.]
MVSIIYNDIDPVSRNSHNYIMHEYENEEMPFALVKVQTELINAMLPELISEPAIFMSKHSSSKSVGSFTVHSEGNWSSKAELGGVANRLSMAAPLEMLNTLIQMSRIKVDGIEVTYEATHHGPLTYKKSFFAEVGGNAEVVASTAMAEFLAKAIINSLDMGNNSNHIAIGIGGNHYASKFTKLALEKGYAFAHIMPRYYASEIEMLNQAFEMSLPRPEIAVVEWKSLSAKERTPILKKLDEIGIDYERV